MLLLMLFPVVYCCCNKVQLLILLLQFRFHFRPLSFGYSPLSQSMPQITDTQTKYLRLILVRCCSKSEKQVLTNWKAAFYTGLKFNVITIIDIHSDQNLFCRILNTLPSMRNHYGRLASKIPTRTLRLWLRWIPSSRSTCSLWWTWEAFLTLIPCYW